MSIVNMLPPSRILLLLLVIRVQSDFSPKLSFHSLLLDYNSRQLNVSTTVCPNDAQTLEQDIVGNLTSEENPSLGNCTNNLTNPSSITNVLPMEPQQEPVATVPPTEDAPKQPIATFDEWTKEKLKQEQRKVVAPSSFAAPTPVATPTTPSGRNYASKECGAKVLMSNPEAENTKAVLNDKEQDEYMRNPCNKAENKFVVVELCETIQPRQIVLGNLELFSSGPRDFRVWAAERAGADWQLLGNFTAADTRQQQTFPVSTRLYAKLVKLELLSHYGNEHYCTLSVMKVLGISMVDEYEIEAEAAVRRPVMVETVEQVTTPPKQEASGDAASNSDLPKMIDLPPVTVETMPVTNTPAPQEEQKPIVKNVVDRVASFVTSLTGSGQDDSKRDRPSKKFKPFDMSLCQVCPLNPTCIVPTHLCWVFVWRPPPRNLTVPIASLALPSRRVMSERRRRRRIAAHQRLMTKKRNLLEPVEMPMSIPPIVDITTELPPVEVITDAPPPTPPNLLSQGADAIPASSVSHKESVFMKLNKRIAALELNMSLSSEYLSELSRQYVAQTDEHKKHLEQARRAAQEVAEEVENRLNKAMSERMLVMRKEMDSLAEFLNSLRVAASEPSLSRFNWHSSESKEKCSSEDVTDLKRYIGKMEMDKDGFWTTEQVVYVVIAAQITTATVLLLMMCYHWVRKRPAVEGNELEQLIAEKVDEVLRAKGIPSVQPPAAEANPAIAKKKHRRRNRIAPHLDAVYASSDSAVSRTSCQTETSSEAESARAAQGLLDVTIRPASPDKSEEEAPWIPVKRKTSSHNRPNHSSH